MNDERQWGDAPEEILVEADGYAARVGERYLVTDEDGADRTEAVIGRAFLAGAFAEAERRHMTAARTDVLTRRSPRPAGKPFDEEERRVLTALDAVDSCSAKRIVWNRAFIELAKGELAMGTSPTVIFRRAGVGPEVIGHKRIERCVARWRGQMEKERTGDERA